jgi:hypothetical protein
MGEDDRCHSEHSAGLKMRACSDVLVNDTRQSVLILLMLHKQSATAAIDRR